MLISWMFVSCTHPSPASRWNLILSVLVFGGGTFARWLGHEGEPLWMGLVSLQKRPRRYLPLSLSTMWEDSIYEPQSEPDTEPSLNFDFGLSRLQNCGKYISVVPSHPVYGILLEQPSGPSQSKGLKWDSANFKSQLYLVVFALSK